MFRLTSELSLLTFFTFTWAQHFIKDDNDCLPVVCVCVRARTEPSFTIQKSPAPSLCSIQTGYWIPNDSNNERPYTDQTKQAHYTAYLFAIRR
jgi:hypothetical protein